MTTYTRASKKFRVTEQETGHVETTGHTIHCCELSKMHIVYRFLTEFIITQKLCWACRGKVGLSRPNVNSQFIYLLEDPSTVQTTGGVCKRSAVEMGGQNFWIFEKKICHRL